MPSTKLQDPTVCEGCGVDKELTAHVREEVSLEIESTFSIKPNLTEDQESEIAWYIGEQCGIPPSRLTVWVDCKVHWKG